MKQGTQDVQQSGELGLSSSSSATSCKSGWATGTTHASKLECWNVLWWTFMHNVLCNRWFILQDWKLFYFLHCLLCCLGKASQPLGADKAEIWHVRGPTKVQPSASISLIAIIISSQSRDCSQIWLRIQYTNGLALKSF